MGHLHPKKCFHLEWRSLRTIAVTKQYYINYGCKNFYVTGSDKNITKVTVTNNRLHCDRPDNENSKKRKITPFTVNTEIENTKKNTAVIYECS